MAGEIPEMERDQEIDITKGLAIKCQNELKIECGNVQGGGGDRERGIKQEMTLLQQYTRDSVRVVREPT